MPKEDQVLSPEEHELLTDLRHRGFAITIWYPCELKGVNRRHVEDRLIELGHQVIEDLED